MNRHIQKVKIYFTGVLLFLGALIVVGIFAVRSERSLTLLAAENTLDFLQYKIESDYGNSGFRLLATILQTFTGTSPRAQAEQSAVAAVPVLVYHGIVQESDRFNITPENFKDHMFALKREGYQTISLQDFEAFTKGEKHLPEKSFLLTFDDGRRDSYYGADPVLKALNYRAVMFVATGQSLPQEFRKPGNYLSKDELRQMHASGRWEIQSHAVQEEGGFVQIAADGTTGNFLSNKKWLAQEQRIETDEEYRTRITYELTNSKTRIEEEIGSEVIAFAFPFSDYGQQTQNNPTAQEVIGSVAAQEYNVLFKQNPPTSGGFAFNYPEDETENYEKRLEPHPSWSASQLIALLRQGEPKMFPYEDVFEAQQGWKRVWGNVVVDTAVKSLKTSATEQTQGSLTVLDGTRSWNNYLFSAVMRIQKGSYVSLVGRYTSNNNNVACVFGPGYVRVVQAVNGTQTTLTEERTELSFANGNEYVFGLRTEGNVVGCYFENKRITGAGGISDSLREGGIGIKTWDEEANNTFVEITRVSVINTSPNAEERTVLGNVPRAPVETLAPAAYTEAHASTTAARAKSQGTTPSPKPEKNVSPRGNFTELWERMGASGRSNAFRPVHRQESERSNRKTFQKIPVFFGVPAGKTGGI
jgi:peptidoglycan/xylan/chitin deacetylase (PgdA/CDA1 family)